MYSIYDWFPGFAKKKLKNQRMKAGQLWTVVLQTCPNNSIGRPNSAKSRLSQSGLGLRFFGFFGIGRIGLPPKICPSNLPEIGVLQEALLLLSEFSVLPAISSVQSECLCQMRILKISYFPVWTAMFFKSGLTNWNFNWTTAFSLILAIGIGIGAIWRYRDWDWVRKK